MILRELNLISFVHYKISLHKEQNIDNLLFVLINWVCCFTIRVDVSFSNLYVIKIYIKIHLDC